LIAAEALDQGLATRGIKLGGQLAVVIETKKGWPSAPTDTSALAPTAHFSNTIFSSAPPDALFTSRHVTGAGRFSW
jgi:hypothetical protein